MHVTINEIITMYFNYLNFVSLLLFNALPYAQLVHIPIYSDTFSIAAEIGAIDIHISI